MTPNATRNGTATTVSARHIFPFFKLPRELCDEIYDTCHEDRQIKLRSGLRVVAKNVANRNLLAVSRQLQQEYQERANQNVTLHLTDHDQFKCRSTSQATLPAPLLNYRSLSFEFIAYNKSVVSVAGINGYVYRNWIGRLVEQMPRLESLSLRMNVQEEDVRHGLAHLRDEICQGCWPELPHLVDLRVYVAEEWWDFNDNSQLVLRFSKVTGQHEVVAEE